MSSAASTIAVSAGDQVGFITINRGDWSLGCYRDCRRAPRGRAMNAPIADVNSNKLGAVAARLVLNEVLTISRGQCKGPQ